jgi:hypothetical protein
LKKSAETPLILRGDDAIDGPALQLSSTAVLAM